MLDEIIASVQEKHEDPAKWETLTTESGICLILPREVMKVQEAFFWPCPLSDHHLEYFHLLRLPKTIVETTTNARCSKLPCARLWHCSEDITKEVRAQKTLVGLPRNSIKASGPQVSYIEP